MLRLDVTSLVWAFFVQKKRRITWKYKKKIKEIQMRKSLR